MRVPSPTEPRVGIPKQVGNYQQGAQADFSPLVRGLNRASAGLEVMAQSQAQLDAYAKKEAENLKRFKATQAFTDFDTNARLKLQELANASPPDDLNFADRAVTSFENMESEFIAGIDPELQEEFRTRTGQIKQDIALNAFKQQQSQLETYYKGQIDSANNNAKIAIGERPEELELWKARTEELIDNSSLSEADKAVMKQQNAMLLERVAYGKVVQQTKLNGVRYANDLKTSAEQAAAELGTTPLDLLTVISFETMGTFDPDVMGGKGGEYQGLIQFSPENQKKYGITRGMTVGEQMGAVVQYLKDRGYKPGMSIYDLYSTINAGAPGRYNASDAKNGGTPGTVRDKVDSQMGAHRAKAAALLGGTYAPSDSLDTDPRFANVPYEDRISLRREADTAVNQMLVEQEKRRKEVITQFQNTLFVDLLENRAGRSEIADAIEAGLLNDFEDRKKAYDIVEKREKDGEILNNFVGKLNGNGFIDFNDPDDRKGVDQFFGKEGIQALNNRDEAFVSGQLVPFYNKYGIIPPSAIGTLDTMARSNDGRNVEFANQALSLLENVNPTAYRRQVPEAAQKRADRWEALQGITSEEERFEILKEPPNQQMRNAREQNRVEAEKFFSDPKHPNYRDFTNVLDVFDPGILSSVDKTALDWAAKGMASDYKTLWIENYSKTGSADAADQATNAQIKRIWSISTVGVEQGMVSSNGILMRNAPEKFYPTVAGSHEWMTNQLRGELGLAPDQKVQLIGDNQTQAEIERGEPPSYGVVVIHPDGRVEQLMRNNQFVRQYFEVSEADKEVHKQSLRVQQLEAELTQLKLAATPATPLDTVAPPDDLVNEIAAKEAQLAALKGEEEAKKVAAKTQYSSPAQTELIGLEKQLSELQNELYTFTGPIETWPRVKEMADLIDKINTTRTIAEQDARLRKEGVKVP